MNFLSVNIRGIRVEKKEAWIRNLKECNGVSFLMFQETQAGDLGNFDWNLY